MQFDPTLLGGMSAEQFLREYWQKKPLLVRQALPGFAPDLTPEELAGMACDEDVTSRLVLEKGGSKPWEARFGPFSEEDFTRLPDSHWSLLVQNVEKHLPQYTELVDRFRFIPDWRIDDLMVSFAPTDGSVGPHVDDYDVFLIQGMGRRRWRISTEPVDEDNFIPGLDLRIMRDFRPTQEWVLETGDLLYLPPMVAHHGISLGPSMNFSVGFRAPDPKEIVNSYINWLLQEMPPQRRMTDGDLLLQDNPGEISRQALQGISELLKKNLPTSAEELAPWFGCFITEPRSEFETQARECPLDTEVFRQRLAACGRLRRNEFSRFGYIPTADGCYLFVDGQGHLLNERMAFAAPLLCAERELKLTDIQDHLVEPMFIELLTLLFNEGHLYFPDE
jgi:50S ribosomal protein L16 3-hydroxylase